MRTCSLAVSLVATAAAWIRGGVSGTVGDRSGRRFVPAHDVGGVFGALAVTS